MSVQCRSCGHLSRDTEFCDRCNADLGKSAIALPPERCPVTPGGISLSLEQRNALCFPDASALISGERSAWRVHWVANDDWQERSRAIQRRLALKGPAFAEGRIVEDTAGRWLIYDATPQQALPWELPRQEGLDDLHALSVAVRSLTLTLESLHRESLVWLSFDPHSLEDGSGIEGPAPRPLRITNLDLAVFPFASMPERVRVHPHFAAPEIAAYRLSEIGPRSDVYHLAVFTYYWLAGALPDGLPGGGLEHHQYELPALRVFATNLPPGIVPVVARGASANVHERYPSPRQFADALDQAIANARLRLDASPRISWDIGGLTRAGRCKAEANRSNEDTILIKDDDHCALLAVADGVSTCDIGSGGLASMMSVMMVENAFAGGCTHDGFPTLIAGTTRRSSEALLEWALANNCQAELEAGKDLMGTTLTVAWLHGRQMSVANLGDSRAYLVTGNVIEQLTVDGDLASDLLARGAAPEEVKELGVMARALRECVGGCTKGDDGELTILEESAQPRVSRWPLLPGDIVVLCSDGLVEEGFFLEPEMVAAIVRRNQHESASNIATRLVDAADAMQRIPSALDPDGFGDNISCIVVKIMEAP
jgi:protein phosphatase